MSNFSLSINRLILKDKDSLNSGIVALVRCKICDSVLTDPYDCLCCNNTFCFTCINNYILKYKKCPYESNIMLNENEEFNAFNMLKPANTNLTSFLTNLKFSCINKSLGCNEEIGYNNIMIHEMGCPFGNQNNSHNNTLIITNPNSQNESFNVNRKLSIMSFNMKNEQSSEIHTHAQGGEMQNTSEKIDKIYEYLQYIQCTLNSKNIFSTPTKEFLPDTPKFSLSLPNNAFKTESNNAGAGKNNFQNNINTTESHHYHGNAYNLTFNLQQEKIISEIELINGKISGIENLIENSMNQSENMLKRIVEEQFGILLEKLRDNITSTNYSSTSNSFANSLFGGNFPKAKSSSKLETSTEVKRIRIDKNKIKVKEKKSITNGNLFTTPCKSSSSTNSPRLINKALFKEEAKTNKKESVKVMNDLEQKILPPMEYFTANEGIVEKMEKFEKNLFDALNLATDNIKSSINSKLVDEIKTCFLEVTLDSTNLFIQRFDELNKILNVN